MSHKSVMGIFKKPLNNPISSGFKSAYASRNGVAIVGDGADRTMYVKGTKLFSMDWPKNFNDLRQGARERRYKKQGPKLDSIAERFAVKNVYGHSRGAAMISDMKYGRPLINGMARPTVNYVGYNGAMRIANRRNMNQLNYVERQPFDKFIARGGTNNRYVKRKHILQFHKAYY